jgi:large subunit ribosomal protein L16
MEFFSRPKKYKTYHKIWYKNYRRYFSLSKNCFGLRCNLSYKLQIKHLKLILKFLKKKLKPYGKRTNIKLRTYPDIIITKKPKDIRMGRGKGNPIYKESHIKGGNVIVEISGVLNYIAYSILTKCSYKLKVKCSFVENIKEILPLLQNNDFLPLIQNNDLDLPLIQNKENINLNKTIKNKQHNIKKKYNSKNKQEISQEYTNTELFLNDNNYPKNISIFLKNNQLILY